MAAGEPLKGAVLEFIIFIGVIRGVALEAQEAILKAPLAEMSLPLCQAPASGIFYPGFRLCWFPGSVLMGLFSRHLPDDTHCLFGNCPASGRVPSLSGVQGCTPGAPAPMN